MQILSLEASRKPWGAKEGAKEARRSQARSQDEPGAKQGARRSLACQQEARRSQENPGGCKSLPLKPAGSSQEAREVRKAKAARSPWEQCPWSQQEAIWRKEDPGEPGVARKPGEAGKSQEVLALGGFPNGLEGQGAKRPRKPAGGALGCSSWLLLVLAFEASRKPGSQETRAKHGRGRRSQEPSQGSQESLGGQGARKARELGKPGSHEADARRLGKPGSQAGAKRSQESKEARGSQEEPGKPGKPLLRASFREPESQKAGTSLSPYVVRVSESQRARKLGPPRFS
jgi:hypothetical protein